MKTHIWFMLLFILVSGSCSNEETKPQSSSKELTGLAFEGLSGAVITYDASNFTYSVTVPNGTDVKALKLSFTLSSGATSKPASGTPQDFSAPVIYTVTAEDGSTQTVAVNVQKPGGVMSEALIAYYSFDKNDCRNDAGSEVAGTLKDNAGFADGKKNRALQLDGSGDYVDLGRGFRLTNEFTVACWINPDVVNRSDAAIFAKYETNSYGPYDFYLINNRPAFWISDGRGSYTVVQSNGTIKAGEWVHVAWVGSKNKLSIYINGQFDKEQSIPAMTTNNDLVTIGRQALLFNTSGALEFKGKIDELRVYNTPLSETNLKDLLK